MKDIRSFVDVWKKYMYVLTPAQKRWGIVVFIVCFLSALAELLGISIIIPVVQAMININVLRENIYISKLCKYFNVISDYQLIKILILCVILVYLIKNLYLFLATWIKIKYTYKVRREISVNMIYAYIRRGYIFLKTKNIAEVVRGCGDSITNFTDVIFCFFTIISDLLMMLCVFLFLLFVDLKMTMGLLLIALICLGLVAGLFRKASQVAGKEYFEKNMICNKWIHQIFYGIKEVLVMNKAKYFVKKYEETFMEQQKAGITKSIATNTPPYIIETFCVIGIMMVIFFKIGNTSDISSYITIIASFALSVFRILPCVGRVSVNINFIVYFLNNINEVYDNFMESKAWQKNIEDTNPKISVGNMKFSNKVNIKEIKFRYPNTSENILDSISITINKGESIAIIGQSGAGKSTLADILLGLIKPDEGNITIDDMDIFDNKELWAQNIAFVPQNVYLLDDTIKNNVCFGNDYQDENYIWKVLEEAQIKEYIENLPEKLDTIIGERGVRMSGGQIQRLAIARALYNKPEILVLDEATSALDNETEKNVMCAIDKLQGKMTIIIIAHRLSTIKKCDRIYEICNGKVNERKYEELT